MSTPLTDAIEALTAYANTVTGSTTDDTLSEAIATLVAGYGGGSKTRSLIYNWDLTSSLTDTIGGLTITLSNATHDSNGLTLGSGDAKATIPVPFAEDMSYEFDISSMSKDFSSGHGRLVMTPNANGTGFISQNGSAWRIYDHGTWLESSFNTDATLFSGKTLKIDTDFYYGAYPKSSSNQTEYTCIIPKFYVNDTLFYQPNGTMYPTSYMMLGADSASFYTAVFTGIRVYQYS